MSKKFLSHVKVYSAIIFPPLIILLGAFLFYFSPYSFIPDYLKIHSYSKIYELLSLMVTSISTLIGIYITVSLIAYEFFRQKSGIELHRSFLLNKLNTVYVSFTITTIIFLFFSSILINIQAPDNKNVSLIYYNIILFVTDILSLLPVAFNLFSSLKPEQVANLEINKINIDNIFIKLKNQDDIDEISNAYEKDPLLNTQEITLSLASALDKVAVQYIMFRVTYKLADLIIEAPSSIFKKNKKEYVTARLISFYINIADVVLLQANNNFLLQSIWLSVGRLYSVCVTKKETAKHFEYIRKNFIERYFTRLFENNKVEVINTGILTLKEIIEKQVLCNTPSEEKIIALDHLIRSREPNFEARTDYDKTDFEIEDHWIEVAFELMTCYLEVMNKAIKFNKPEIINKVAEDLNSLTHEFNSKKIGQYKESYFYINASGIILDYYLLAFQKSVFSEGSDAKYPVPTLFDSLIEDQHIAARTVLQKYCFWLMSIQKLGKLDYWLLGGITIGNFIITEGELGSIAKRCAIKYSKGKEIQECLSDCINTYANLKDFYEINPPKDFGLYIQIKKQLENILHWLTREKADAPTVIENLNSLIASFKQTL